MTSSHRPTVKLSPLDNVYSYFVFAVPMEEQKRPGKFGYNKLLAYMLVTLSVVLQAVLLYAIFVKVVGGDIKWRNKILNPQGETMFGTVTNKQQCNPGGALCMKVNGTYTCAPPSVQLTGRWDELDTDGDGIWTREEVMEKREELKCKYVVDPLEVYDIFVKFLIAREGVIWIHPELRAGQKIHKAYFTYAAGDIIMCSYRNTDMCANLLQRGVFDAPLKYGTAPRVGTTIDSALEYCYGLLEQGGVCERTLPSTYAVWQKTSAEQCLDTDFDTFVYKHPTTGIRKSMLVVDYDAREDYARAGESSLFLVYKTVIISVYLLVMLGELKDIIMIGTWVARYPSPPPQDRDEEAVQASGGEEEPENVIKGITTKHRCVVGVFLACRLIMLFMLVWVGLLFLLKDTDYINLLLNSLGLIVIVEIIQQMYVYLISPELREEVEGMEPMEVPAAGPTKLNSTPALRDLVVIVLFILTVITIMSLNHVLIVKPLANALECACLSQGENCFEAHAFSHDFWNKYWKHDVPAVFGELDVLKAKLPKDPDGAAEASSSAKTSFIAAGAPRKVRAKDADPVPKARRHAVGGVLAAGGSPSHRPRE